MKFDEFNNLLKNLSIFSKEEMPSFVIIKDLFDYIDMRKDGAIDIHEWMQSFRKIEEV